MGFLGGSEGKESVYNAGDRGLIPGSRSIPLEKGMTEDEIFGWHHQLNGHEFEQAPGDGEGQGSLACCSTWGHTESDMTE